MKCSQKKKKAAEPKFLFLPSSRPRLRPELQRGQKPLAGHPVEGSRLRRSECRHRILCGHGQEGLVRLCHPEPGARETTLPAGELAILGYKHREEEPLVTM